MAPTCTRFLLDSRRAVPEHARRAGEILKSYTHQGRATPRTQCKRVVGGCECPAQPLVLPAVSLPFSWGVGVSERVFGGVQVEPVPFGLVRHLCSSFRWSQPKPFRTGSLTWLKAWCPVLLCFFQGYALSEDELCWRSKGRAMSVAQRVTRWWSGPSARVPRPLGLSGGLESPKEQRLLRGRIIRLRPGPWH